MEDAPPDVRQKCTNPPDRPSTNPLGPALRPAVARVSIVRPVKCTRLGVGVEHGAATPHVNFPLFAAQCTDAVNTDLFCFFEARFVFHHVPRAQKLTMQGNGAASYRTGRSRAGSISLGVSIHPEG